MCVFDYFKWNIHGWNPAVLPWALGVSGDFLVARSSSQASENESKLNGHLHRWLVVLGIGISSSILYFKDLTLLPRWFVHFPPNHSPEVLHLLHFYKMGPYDRYKWSYGAPINGLINGQLGLFHPYFSGVMGPTSNGAYFVPFFFSPKTRCFSRVPGLVNVGLLRGRLRQRRHQTTAPGGALRPQRCGGQTPRSDTKTIFTGIFWFLTGESKRRTMISSDVDKKQMEQDVARREEMSLGSAESRICFFGRSFQGRTGFSLCIMLWQSEKTEVILLWVFKDDKSILPWSLILRNIRGIRSIKVMLHFRFLTWLIPWGLPKPCNSEEIIDSFLWREPYQSSLSTVKQCFGRTQLISFNHFSFLCSRQDLVQLSQLQQGSTEEIAG